MSPYNLTPDNATERAILPPLILSFPSSSSSSSLAIFHVTLPNLSSSSSDLLDVLHAEFNDELERGDTYPQEGPQSFDEFKSYFFARDVFVGIKVDESRQTPPDLILEKVRGSRTWKEAVAGFYYIKPNYPGRSSHICNAGFVVPHTYRGQGIGRLLAQSYLHFAPLLGYRGSIFNLVYATNIASLALWDKLGFTRIGVVPRAGRLKQADASEEYVDALVIWKSFEGVV